MQVISRGFGDFEHLVRAKCWGDFWEKKKMKKRLASASENMYKNTVSYGKRNRHRLEMIHKRWFWQKIQKFNFAKMPFRNRKRVSIISITTNEGGVWMLLMASRLLLAACAATTDCLHGKIPNGIILLGYLLGISYRIMGALDVGWGVLILRMLWPILALFPVFLIRGMGAGDLKLFSLL